MTNPSEPSFVIFLDFERQVKAEEAALEAFVFSRPSNRSSLSSDDGVVTPDTVSEVNTIKEEHTPDPNLVDWDGFNDPANPQNFSHRRKVGLTALVMLLTVNVTFASSSPSTATLAIAAHFHVSQEVAILVTSLFLGGYVFGPIVWSGLSETYGRRPVFVATMIAYILFSLGQPLAKNIQTLLVTRFLAGFFASVPLTNAGGFIADVWDPVGRGKAAAVFCATAFLGPIGGPIVGSFVVSSPLGWKGVFWVIIIFSLVCWVLCVVFLQETYAPVILSQKASRIRKAGNPHAYTSFEANKNTSLWGLLERTLLRPFVMLTREPILVLITLYMGLIYGLVYGLLEVLPIIFIELRGIKPNIGGLLFAGVGVGTTIGASYSFYVGKDYAELVAKWRGFPPPEARLGGAMIGGPLLVIAIFWLGWTGAYTTFPWYFVELSTILLGCSMALIFVSFISYIIDTYLLYAASAMAANSIVRSAAGAGFPLFTGQLFHNLGVQWASTILGCISLLMAPMPFLFWKYGARIRGRSTFAPCKDLKIKEEIGREIDQRSSIAKDLEDWNLFCDQLASAFTIGDSTDGQMVCNSQHK